MNVLKSHGLLFCLIIAAVCFNLYWHDTHRNPPVVTAHETHLSALKQIVEFRRAPLSYVANFFSLPGRTSFFSLYNVSAILPTSVFGVGYRQMALTSLIYYILAVVFVYGAARRLGAFYAAVPAAAVAATIPDVFMWSVTFNSRIAVVAAAACALYLLVRSESLTRPRTNAALLILVFLSLFLGETVGENVQVTLLAAWGLVYLLIRQFVGKNPERKKTLAWFAIFCLAAAATLIVAFAGEGYLHKFLGYFQREAATKPNPLHASDGVRSNPAALLAYPILFYHKSLLPFLGILSGLSCVFLAASFNKKDGLVLVCLLGPLIVISLFGKKDFIYALFLMPVVAVAIGAAAGRLRSRLFSCALAAVILFVGAANLYGLSFPREPGPSLKLKHDVALNRYKDMFMGTPDSLWPDPASEYEPEKIAAEISQSAKEAGTIRVVLLADNTKDAAAMFRYFLRMKNPGGEMEIFDPFQRDFHSKYLPPAGEKETAEFVPDYVVDFLSSVDATQTRNPYERFQAFYAYTMRESSVSFSGDAYEKIQSLLSTVIWEKYERREIKCERSTILIYKRRLDEK